MIGLFLNFYGVCLLRVYGGINFASKRSRQVDALAFR
jgi:hypothetical protein